MWERLSTFISKLNPHSGFAILIFIGGGLLIGYAHMNDTGTNRIFDLMFLAGSYYFSASKSGTTKDDTINNLTKNQNQ